MDFDEIKELIKSKLDDAEVVIVDLTGGRDHLGITVKSSHFKGKLLLDQHRMVMDILKEKLNSAEIHAVQLKTISKKEEGE